MAFDTEGRVMAAAAVTFLPVLRRVRERDESEGEVKAWCLLGARIEVWIGPREIHVGVDALDARDAAREWSPEDQLAFRDELGEAGDTYVTWRAPRRHAVAALLRAREIARLTRPRTHTNDIALRMCPERPEEEMDEAEPEKRWIREDVDEHRVVDETVSALSRRRDLYVRAGTLVELDAEARIRVITRDRARDLATEAATYYHERCSDKGERQMVPVHPPRYLGGAILSRPGYPRMRPLVGVVRAPILREDGSIVETPGYDAATRLYYAPSTDYPPVPAQASVHAARDAYCRLAELFGDFPFVDPDLGIAVSVAGILTLLARHLVDCVPTDVANGAQPGSGKGLRADAMTLVGLGRCLPRSPWSPDEHERRKLLDGAVRAGDDALLLDNIASPLGGSDLERVVTSTDVVVRILGRSEAPTYPQRMSIIVTGNNVRYEGDMPRRVLETRLVPPDDRPDARTTWAIPVLRAYIANHRARLTVYALTILAAHARAGRPMAQRDDGWGSYEQWTRIVADAVVFAGGIDPLGARVVRSERSDTVRESLEGLIRVWLAFGGAPGVELACAQLLQRVAGDAEARAFLAEVLDTEAPATGAKDSDAGRLTRVLTRHAERWVSVDGRLLGFVRGSSGKYGRRWMLSSPTG